MKQKKGKTENTGIKQITIETNRDEAEISLKHDRHVWNGHQTVFIRKSSVKRICDLVWFIVKFIQNSGASSNLKKVSAVGAFGSFNLLVFISLLFHLVSEFPLDLNSK